MKQLRAAFRFVTFATVSLVLYGAWILGSLIIPNRRLWRDTLFNAWSRAFAGIVGMRLKVVGDPPKPPFFLASNHLGTPDIPALRLAAKGVFVAKSEMGEWPIAGGMIRSMGNVFIDRESRRDIPRATRDVLAKLEDREGVIIFPEGKSTRGDSILPYNSSFFEVAAAHSVPVWAATIRYETPEGSPPPSHSICWWDDIGFLDHFWRMLLLPGFDATVTFEPRPFSGTDRKALAREVHDAAAARFRAMR